jgi:hypothetical protein
MTPRTKTRIQRKWSRDRMEYDIDIPKGTRCRRIPEGQTMGKYWVDDLTWVPKDQGFLRHDATHYGIVLEPDEVEDCPN